MINVSTDFKIISLVCSILRSVFSGGFKRGEGESASPQPNFSHALLGKNSVATLPSPILSPIFMDVLGEIAKIKLRRSPAPFHLAPIGWEVLDPQLVFSRWLLLLFSRKVTSARLSADPFVHSLSSRKFAGVFYLNATSPPPTPSLPSFLPRSKYFSFLSRFLNAIVLLDQELASRNVGL